MKSPQRVVWSEGMFMTPQHMQQLDRYHENFVDVRVSAMGPLSWGAMYVEIDQRALAAQQLRVQKFTGVLPDGLPVVFEENHPEAPPARPIEGHFPPTARVLEVYLGSPLERDGVANYVAPGGQTQAARFTSTSRSVFDVTSGANEVPLAFGQKNLFILFGDEARDNYEAIKVAEIVRDPNGALIPREGFVPPVRRIGASPFIMKRLRETLAFMAAKQRSLAENRRQRDGATVEFNAGDVTSYLLLNAINTFLPILSHLIDAQDTPPDTAYLLLSQFAGQLCAFAVDSDPTTLPKFLYTDLGTTFDQLFTRIMELLQRTVKERYIQVPLESRSDGLHYGHLADDRLTRTTTYVLTIRTEIPEQQTADQLPKLSKIASFQDIGTIVQTALPGVPLQVTYRPPPEIPAKQGTVYFQLNTSDRFWRNIVAERSIAIFLPPPFEVAKIKLELLAVPPAG